MVLYKNDSIIYGFGRKQHFQHNEVIIFLVKIIGLHKDIFAHNSSKTGIFLF